MIFKVATRATKSWNYLPLYRHLNSKIPSKPVSTLENEHIAPAKVDRNTVALLERLSLVKYDTEEGLKILEDSITFANKILHINTDGVQPLYSVLEERNLTLRKDNITQGNCQKDILRNAAVKDDDYFVAPTGNIPLHEVEPEQAPIKVKQDDNRDQKLI